MPRAASLKVQVTMTPAPLLALLLLAAPPAKADPGILLFPSLGRPDSLTVRGRVLEHMPSQGSSTLSRNLRRLLVNTWKGAEVEVGFGDQRQKAVSGDDGVFEVTFTAPPGKPYFSGLHPVEARAPWGHARGTVSIVAHEAPFFVISDFDDTIAVSNVINLKKVAKSALLQDGRTQPVVPGMAPFYRCLLSDKPTRPGLAVVTGSPWQYGLRMAEFLARNDFPFAGLYPRQLGPKTLSNYKQPVIRELLRQLPNPVILVGDSGEKDPEVYAEIRKEFPDRIARIYIRKVRDTEPSSRFPGMVLFSDPREAADDAVRQGFLTSTCVEAVFAKPAPRVEATDP
jgi:phosphatidate phosphatase APP1